MRGRAPKAPGAEEGLPREEGAPGGPGGSGGSGALAYMFSYSPPGGARRRAAAAYLGATSLARQAASCFRTSSASIALSGA